MSSGTSTPINITGQSFSPLKNVTFSPIENDGQSVNPPLPKGNLPSQAMLIYQNPFRDFAFQKVTPPYYGSQDSDLPRYTGIPANNPDYIADFHFISLMRLIDTFMQHRYEGYIGGTIDTIDGSNDFGGK